MKSPKIKRVYEPRETDDGKRVLIDRLWPRGVRKDALADVLWLKEIAPSTALRRWFDHRPERWAEFQSRYFAELDAVPGAVATLRAMMRKGRVTLLYSSRNRDHNHAIALKGYLLR